MRQQKRFKFFTGLTHEEFSALYEFLNPEGAKLKLWHESKKTGRPSISFKCQLAITLWRLVILLMLPSMSILPRILWIANAVTSQLWRHSNVCNVCQQAPESPYNYGPMEGGRDGVEWVWVSGGPIVISSLVCEDFVVAVSARLEYKAPCCACRLSAKQGRGGGLVPQYSHDICRWVVKLICQDLYVQGDTSCCLKPPVDFKTKVPFWSGQARTGQARSKRNFCFEVNGRF